MLDFFGSQVWTNLLVVFVLVMAIELGLRRNRREYRHHRVKGDEALERQRESLARLDEMVALLKEISAKLDRS